MKAANKADAALIYDGECPFCSAYVRYVRLKESVGKVELIDARDGGPLVEEVMSKGFDLNEGMVLHLGGRFYHGAECIHALALLSSPVGPFNRANAWIFRSRRLSAVLYPVLRFGRNCTLLALGRRKLTSKT